MLKKIPNDWFFSFEHLGPGEKEGDKYMNVGTICPALKPLQEGLKKLILEIVKYLKLLLSTQRGN